MCFGGFESQIIQNCKIIVFYSTISISLACPSNYTGDFVIFRRLIMWIQSMVTVVFILAMRCSIFSREIDMDNDIAVQIHTITAAILIFWMREGYIEAMTLLYRLSTSSPFLFIVFFFLRQKYRVSESTKPSLTAVSTLSNLQNRFMLGRDGKGRNLGSHPLCLQCQGSSQRLSFVRWLWPRSVMLLEGDTGARSGKYLSKITLNRKKTSSHSR
jgi:hypothetical protein